MEVLADELLHHHLLAFDFLTQCAVVEGTELLDDTINHGRRENIVLLVDLALTLQTVG